jgi:hypothetical protein
MIEYSIYVGIALAIVGTYFVAEHKQRSRYYGFLFYLGSNSLWLIYGIFKQDMPVIVQFSIFGSSTLNRG